MKQRGKLTYHEHQIQIVEDYSPEVVSQLAEYREAMSEPYN